MFNFINIKKILYYCYIFFAIIVSIFIAFYFFFNSQKCTSFICVDYKYKYIRFLENRTPFGFYSKNRLMKYDTLDQNSVNIMYDMLDFVDKAFKRHNIKYIIDSGTLMGAIRHGGLIPWDIDADLVVLNATPAQIFNALHDSMSDKENHKFFLLHFSDVIDVIRLGHRDAIYRRFSKNDLSSFPQIDILYGFEKCDDGFYRYKVSRKQDRCQTLFPNYYWNYNEIYPLKTCQFGPLKLPCANNPENVFNRYYGSDWKSVGYTGNHIINKARNKKIILTDELKKPALPTNR